MPSFDEYHGQGGSYINTPDGKRVLVERTDWVPPAAPVKKGAAKSAPAEVQPETNEEGA